MTGKLEENDEHRYRYELQYFKPALNKYTINIEHIGFKFHCKIEPG